MDLNINKVKIITTVPSDKLEIIRKAMCDAGAGRIGNYTYCSNSSKVIGTFKPNEKATPFIGKKNKLEYVNEERIEILCDIKNVKKVVSALKTSHPYEEPEIDIIPLLNLDNF